MRKKQSTLAILLFLLVSCIILSGVWYVYFSYNQDNNLLCGDELKKCPDGSFVELGGPLCSYPKCPAPKTPVPASQNPAINQSPASTDTVAPREAVRSFYNWYQELKPAQKQKSSFESRSDLSDNFKTQLQTAGGLDPLLCITGRLDRLDTGTVYVNTGRALVFVMLNEEGSKSQNAAVELVNNNGSWQIDEIFCEPAAIDTTTDTPGNPQWRYDTVTTPPAQSDVK